MANQRPLLFTLLKPLASLRLTVAMMAISIFLVFAGTVAQVDKGIWTVVDEHFRCYFTWFHLRIFFPRSMSVPDIAFPYLGGYTIGIVLLANLLAAHAVRFKMRARGATLALGLIVLAGASVFTWLLIQGMFTKDVAATEGDASLRVLWRLIKGTGAAVALLAGCLIVFRKRAGIVLVHGGVILLLIAEFYTGYRATESQMRIPEGVTRTWTYDQRSMELAVIDPSDPATERVIAIPSSRLKPGKTVRHESLPCDIEVLDFMRNSTVVDASKLPEGVTNPATKGMGVDAMAIVRPQVSGTDPNQTSDRPSAYVRLRADDGSDLGTFMLTSIFLERQKVEIDGKQWELSLRPKRTYKPYSIELLDFVHDVYVGTDRPKDFSSYIRLRDPRRDIDREVRIWMNNPLRYDGETFYQSSYDGSKTTVLQVVRNDSWMIPYVSCMIVLVGLMTHFGFTLQGFLKRRAAS